MYPLLSKIIPEEAQYLAGLLLEETKAKVALGDQTLAKVADFIEAPGMENAKALYCLILHSLELNQVTDLFNYTLNEIAKKEEETERPNHFSHPRARDFYATFLFFNQPASRLPLPEECVRKSATQNFCFAVETEIGFRIEFALGKIWQTRKELIGQFLEMKDNKPHFHPEFAQYLHKTLERYPILSFGGSFEEPIFLNTFRYVLQIAEAKDFRPNLAEAGLIMLALHSQLGMESITENEITELSLRLFRLHKLKMKSISVHNGFDENLWEIFLADRERTLELLKNLHFGKPDEAREVA